MTRAPDPADRAADVVPFGTTHRAGDGRLPWLLAFLSRHPSATLPSGEGARLAAAIPTDDECAAMRDAAAIVAEHGWTAGDETTAAALQRYLHRRARL